MGAVHGNEVCGPKALERVVAEIESGAIEIEAGKLVVIPVCNEQAYDQNAAWKRT